MIRDGIWFGILLAVVAAGVAAQESRAPESRAASRSAAESITFELLPPPARGPQPSEAKVGVGALLPCLRGGFHSSERDRI